mgnify:CR=1 FL=1
MYINFSDIPGHQNLFLDYLHEFDNVERFYRKNFRAIETYEDFFKTLSMKERPNREKLVEIIKSQYSESKISKQTHINIESLNSNKTIAVVTGQQLGLFGGPLYTIYKSITAIKLCNFLKEKYDEFHFVPVFWLEGDDHDYDEVRKSSFLNNENNLINLQYDDGLLDDINRGSTAELKFNENLEKVFEELTQTLRETEFKLPLIDFMKSIYKPGKTFLETFRELMIKLFDEFGLIVFNPVDNEVKKLLLPIFTKEITSFRDHTSYIVERSAELEEVYHAQVKVKPVNLFVVENNERLLIEPVENEFRLKGKRKKYTQEELLELLNTSPGKFSPNVLLRPICQDYLFPTAFYVGGPAEISYFAQVVPMYDIYNLSQPYIYPRSSATIVERGVKNVIDKYNLNYTDIFVSEEDLISKIAAMKGEVNIDEIYNQTSIEFERTINELNEKLLTIDKTLSDLSNKSKQKVQEVLTNMKTKTLEAERRKHEVTIRQLSKVRNVLYPADNLQERELNLMYFLNKYGPDIFKWVFNELSINKFEHQVLEI